ncbi:MAG: crossover junction endodeoxyribonuclease RuvC [Deltaproteobacteria bacterium]|jgi:crossover junction endodeoxyribonuclease RuvC|nr:crossover junction endodeoxyribonuclease RuvC [Deltaproteobacteria bacterium]
MNPEPGLSLSPILGLDPGSRHTGWGLIETRNGRITLLGQGRLSPPAAWPFPRRLAFIHTGLREIIQKYRPQVCAVEDVFTCKNPRSALKLAQARGAAVLAAALEEIPVMEYTPSQIKNALTGHGQAEKSQVAFLVKSLLGLTEELPPDTTDALAAAVCQASLGPLAAVSAAPAGRSRSKSWSKFSPEDLAALGFKVAEN